MMDTRIPWTYDNDSKLTSAKDKASFKNQVPFSEEMYDIVKTALEMLTGRQKMGTDSLKNPSDLTVDERNSISKMSLTVEEAEWLVQAVELIVADAKVYGPPLKPVNKEFSPTE